MWDSRRANQAVPTCPHLDRETSLPMRLRKATIMIAGHALPWKRSSGAADLYGPRTAGGGPPKELAHGVHVRMLPRAMVSDPLCPSTSASLRVELELIIIMHRYPCIWPSITLTTKSHLQAACMTVPVRFTCNLISCRCSQKFVTVAFFVLPSPNLLACDQHDKEVRSRIDREWVVGLPHTPP